MYLLQWAKLVKVYNICLHESVINNKHIFAFFTDISTRLSAFLKNFV